MGNNEKKKYHYLSVKQEESNIRELNVDQHAKLMSHYHVKEKSTAMSPQGMDASCIRHQQYKGIRMRGMHIHDASQQKEEHIEVKGRYKRGRLHPFIHPSIHPYDNDAIGLSDGLIHRLTSAFKRAQQKGQRRERDDRGGSVDSAFNSEPRRAAGSNRRPRRMP